ncbi:MAG: F0F1 ATP synthase subunit A [Anaerolineae bacterium]|nr:F0F1 ATP synthase subunit A [Anaerolineae bacterium]
MDLTITPDTIVYWQWGPISLNATIVFTWVVMVVLVGGSWLITRNLSAELKISRWQSLLEMVVLTMRDQIGDIAQQKAGRYLPFVGTLFLFISLANFLSIVPGYQAPTGSLSATSALAICVFFAVPFYGMLERGVTGYLKHYVQPSPILLPFNIISELSRTLALAIRLFGNVMSGAIIVGLLISIVPLFLPVVLEAFELLIGQIQAYIFAILAMVFIASAARTRQEEEQSETEENE